MRQSHRSILLALALAAVAAAMIAQTAHAQVVEAAPPPPAPPAPPLPPAVAVDVVVTTPPLDNTALPALPPAPSDPATAPSLTLPGQETTSTMDPALAGRVLELLHHQSDTYGLARAIGGVASLIGAGAMLGIGLSQLGNSDGEVLVWTGISAVPLFTALGVGLLSLTMPQEDRYERFKLALADGMSPLEYSSLSGELFAESNLARSQRLLGGALSIGIAGSGGLTLLAVSQLFRSTAGPLGALTDTLVYTMPITLLVTGIAGIFFSYLVKSQPEKDWDTFQAGVPPESLTFNVQVSPYATTEGGGVGVTGQF